MSSRPGRGQLPEVPEGLGVAEPSLRLPLPGMGVGPLPFSQQLDFPEPLALSKLHLRPLPIPRALAGIRRTNSRDRQLLSDCRARREHAVRRATRRWTRRIDPQHLEPELSRLDSRHRYRRFLLREFEGPGGPHCASKSADQESIRHRLASRASGLRSLRDPVPASAEPALCLCLLLREVHWWRIRAQFRHGLALLLQCGLWL